jgi:hypothetical protein
VLEVGVKCLLKALPKLETSGVGLNKSCFVVKPRGWREKVMEATKAAAAKVKESSGGGPRKAERTLLILSLKIFREQWRWAHWRGETQHNFRAKLHKGCLKCDEGDDQQQRGWCGAESSQPESSGEITQISEGLEEQVENWGKNLS